MCFFTPLITYIIEVMGQFLQKIPFLIELFFNGSFIFLYSLKSSGKIPDGQNRELIEAMLQVGGYLVPVVVLMTLIVSYLNARGIESFFRKHTFSLVVFVPLVITWGDQKFACLLSFAHLFSSILALYDEGEGAHPIINFSFLKKIKVQSGQWVLLFFFIIIAIGTSLLMVSLSSKGKMPFIDALFMATSAVCVTGLSTLSLPDDLTLFGQWVILGLIQVGGISIMILYSTTILFFGRWMKDRIIMEDLLAISNSEELFSMVIGIIKYTFFIELWGAIALAIAFMFDGQELGQALFHGVFHSISAFCNAGFSTFSNSLEKYATNPFVHGTISVLIILGGVGFIVLRELKEVLTRKKSLVRITLHTKIVLITSFAFIVGGAIFFFFGEFLNALDDYTFFEKVQISFFQSVTLRTAGFHTVSLTNLNVYTVYAMSLLMFIGGSPGSTAGGIKVTTFVILIQSIKSILKGRKTVRLMDRRIPPHVVVRATALTFISIVITSVFILVMLKIEGEKEAFFPIFFEVVSASGTVGLSLGITPYLTTLGKLAIAVMMLIGRIGPLTLVLAIREPAEESSGKFDYPDGRIMIG